MLTHTRRNAAIAIASALATIAVVVVILMVGARIGTPVPGEPIMPALQTTHDATPTNTTVSNETPTDAVVDRASPTAPTSSNCALYGGVDGLPILDTNRCLASDRVVTVE